MFNRFEFFMLNKFLPALAVVNLLWCMGVIMYDGWSWTRGSNIVLSIMYMDWFFNADSTLYRKDK